MDKNKKYQVLKYVLIFSVLAFAFFLWRSVDRAIFAEGASVWMVPGAWSFLFFGALALSVFLIKERTASLSAMAAAFLLSFIFSFSTFHLLVLCVVILLVLVAEGRMRDDFRSRIRIDLGKNIRSGSALIVLGLSLAIAAQYYFTTKDLATEKYLPSFKVGKSTNGLALRLIANFLPQAKDLADENMTVDQFLTGLYEKQMKNLDPAQRMLAEGVLKETGNPILADGRKQLSQIALREVGGEEKISDIFSEILNKKINGYFMPNLVNNQKSALFSAVLALVIFLTLSSLGSFLLLFWIPLIKLIFFIFKKTGVVTVLNIPAEKEVIE